MGTKVQYFSSMANVSVHPVLYIMLHSSGIYIYVPYSGKLLREKIRSISQRKLSWRVN